MIICKTSCGFPFMIDDQDLAFVNQYIWHKLSPENYIWTKLHGKTYLLHRMLLNAIHGTQIDHVDGNPANNCKSNLRYCDYSQNQGNRKKGSYGSNKYKGVCWNKRNNVWQVGIKFHGKRYYIGVYKSEEDAALAYNENAIKYFGEFAKLNIIQNNLEV